MAGKVRLTADLSTEAAATLKRLAAAHGISMTQTLTRALAAEAFLLDARMRGDRVLLKQRNGYREVIFP